MATDIDQNKRARISRHGRFWLAAAGVGLAGLLALSALLTPSPTGCGTHRQLGFPPCTFLTLFGRPCPTCGMTTAWAHLVRGQWRDALRANVGGTVLGLLAVAAVPWLLGTAIRGAWCGVSPSVVVVAWFLAIFTTVVLVDWVLRLAVGRCFWF